LKTIYNPISLREIEEKFREKIDHPFFKDNNAVVVSAGRFVIQKRFDRLLKAFSLLKKQQENACLIILGKGELHDKLKILVSRLNLDKCVDFVGFKFNPYAWISRADIFVLSSDWEGCPNVIIEAMACGLPIIGTEVGGIPDFLIDSKR